MIVSHRYGFIFVKTARVGGTSLEMALSRFLGPEDIITPVSGDYVPNNEVVRFQQGFRTAQNFEKRIHELRPRDLERFLRASILSRVRRTPEGRLLARTRLPHRYWGHMSSEEIRARLGPDVWDRYYKFTVERNPWDKLVAAYHRKNDPSPFREFVRSRVSSRTQFERYTVDGRVAVDRIIRYDRLYQDLAEVSAQIGLPEDVGETMRSFSANASRRGGRDFRPFYDDETRELVALYYARESASWGFRSTTARRRDGGTPGGPGCTRSCTTHGRVARPRSDGHQCGVSAFSRFQSPKRDSRRRISRAKKTSTAQRVHSS